LGLLLAGPAVSFAHDKGDHDKDEHHNTASEMRLMDANRDHKISAQEHADGVRKMFEKMDENKDGKVTVAEMEGCQAKMGFRQHEGEMSAADKLKTVDANQDGVLTAEEHAAGARTMFDKMDTDHDGFLSRKEMAAGRARLMSKDAK
jgi:Ca2+-binding EF-hand superfamily protein